MAEIATYEEKVRKYIITNFLFEAADASLNRSDSLLESGVVDSTGILELVSFLEEEFGIAVRDDELIPDNFDSLEKIAAYIDRKK
jgi:acyl carrier protein